MTTQEMCDALRAAMASGDAETALEMASELLEALARGGAVPSGGAIEGMLPARGLPGMLARLNSML